MHESGVGFQPSTSQLTTVHRTRPAMGTLFEVLLRGDDEEHLAAVAEAILDEALRIERLLSRFDPRSEISRINRLAASEAVQVDRETAALLARCIDSFEQTAGAFDVSVGSGRAVERTPGQIPGIRFDRARRLVQFTAAGVQLDLGGIGKGYALDSAAQLLDEHHVEHALLHGGTSSVLARGLDADKQPWSVSLRHPVSGQGEQVQRLHDEALSCSAVSLQADVIDTMSGRPLTQPAGVAVIARTATDAEVLSTALLCVGRGSRERALLGSRATAIWL
jgi:FAD:protein FMN transferase